MSANIFDEAQIVCVVFKDEPVPTELCLTLFPDYRVEVMLGQVCSGHGSDAAPRYTYRAPVNSPALYGLLP